VCVSLCMSLCVFVFPLCVCVSLSVFKSLFVCVSLCVCFSLSVWMSLSLSQCVVCLSLYVHVSKYVFPIVCVSQCVLCLANALHNFGFKVLGENRGFTRSHQIAVNVLAYSNGGKVEADLEKSNIIVNRQLIPGDLKAGRNYFHPGGIRLGVSEITRLGMKESEMKEIASFIKQIVIDKKDPKGMISKVKSFRRNYQKVQYCFDKKLGAYEYVKLR